MIISKYLMLAILSMNVYNCDGVRLPRTETQIGEAVVHKFLLPNGSITSGFYAIDYKIGTTDIIAYRGTDDGSDVIAWQQFLGSPYSTQGQQALQFYKDVNGGSLAFNSNIVLTGHSLGGGLAGWVAGHTGTGAVAFDNNGFEQAIAAKYEGLAVTTGLFAARITACAR